MSISRTKLLAGGLLSFASLAFPQTPPLGGEFQVNTYTTGSQYGHSIAMDASGNFVVVWTSGGQDGSSGGIFGQRFDGSGIKSGSEFQVNTHTTDDQFEPVVAMDGSGNFVVAWTTGSDSTRDFDVHAQRFDLAGNALGSEFKVNTYTTGVQGVTSVARDAAGRFVVMWESQAQDGSGYGVFGQRFSNSGSKLGSEFQVNTYTFHDQSYGKVAMDSGGNFVVVWSDSGGEDGDEEGVFGQRFDASGTKIGPEFQVNTATTDEQGDYGGPAIAMTPSGNFVVIWSSGPFGFFPDIRGQRFANNGTKIGTEFDVTSSGGGRNVGVATDSSGDFMVVWQDARAFVEPTNIMAQRFDRSGSKVGPQFQVNVASSDYDDSPAVAMDERGGFAVTWNHEPPFSSPPPPNGTDVFRRRQNLLPLSLNVDAHAGADTVSDLNGILEPGEKVIVEPRWWNVSNGAINLTGGASGFSGPAGATYSLTDGFADYGSIPPVTAEVCYIATAAHDCYEVGVSGTRPGAHWDATFAENLSTNGGHGWTIHIGDSFSDVPRSQPFYAKIETLLHNGITSGCTPTTYCPGSPIERSEMAIFIAKGIAGAGTNVPDSGDLVSGHYDCKAGGVSQFVDVSPTDIFCKHVHYIAEQNVTAGCGTGQYCPTGTVTRDEMAAFIARALVAPGGGSAVPLTYTDPNTGRSYSCAAGSPQIHFTDVPVSDPFCKHVHYLWARNILEGCGTNLYCPTSAITRDAMAKFIVNGFGLQLYGP